MTEPVIIRFVDLAIGDRFGSLPYTAEDVLAPRDVYYTKIEPDTDDPIRNAIESPSGRRVTIWALAQVVRLPPVEQAPAPAATHYLTMKLDLEQLRRWELRAAEAGCTVEALAVSMLNEIMEYAGLGGAVLDSTLTIHYKEGGALGETPV